MLEQFIASPCPICRQLAQGAEAPGPWGCLRCQQQLALPRRGLHALQPLPWWAAGRYEGELRRLLLRLRRHPQERTLSALLPGLVEGLPRWQGSPWLVPIPSWKRQANPLPGLLVRQLGLQLGLGRADLLERSHPVLGQHHLNRRMRLANQEGAFRCRGPAATEARRHPLLIVDDILTTGATALSAYRSLEEAGWQVAGLVCLARTPPRGGRAVI